MITGKLINGVSYSIPETGDSAWGDYTTALLTALVDAGIFTGSGSTKSLTQDLNLGTTYGIITGYLTIDHITSDSTNPAAAGAIRLANGDTVSWRNNANSGDIAVTISSGDRLTVAGVNVPTISSTDTLTNKSLSDSTTAIVDVSDATKQLKFDVAGTTGTSTTIQTSQTTNKTITLPDISDTVVTKTSTDVLTNKTIDANGTGNSISNLETADFAANVIDTDGTLAANSDTRVSTQKANKTYADTKLAIASFTDAAVTSKLLTGFSSAAGTVAATDTILQGFNKVTGNITTLSTAFDDMDEPHGWVSGTVSYLGSRQIRIANPVYYYKGTKVSHTGNIDVTVPNVTGNYYVYFQDTTPANATASVSFTFRNIVPYAAFYWNATSSDYLFQAENHGINMSTLSHEKDHNTEGAKFYTGGAASGYVLSSDTLADVQIALGETKFYDEDLLFTQAEKLEGGNWDKWYLLGASEWTKHTADTIPVLHASNEPKINTYSAPNWSLTSVTANNCFNTYIFATNSAETTNRFIVVPGQNQAASVAAAKIYGISSLNLSSLPTKEMLPMYQLTWEYKTSYTNNDARVVLKEVTDLRTTRSPGVSAGVTTSHNSLSGRSDSGAHPASAIANTPAGTIAATDVQTALNELDTDKVAGPASSVDNEIMRFDGTGGKTAQAYTATGPTIDDNGVVTINNATDSSSKDTGALILASGGLGVEGKIYSGSEIHATTSVNTATVNVTTALTVQDPGAGTNKVTIQAPTLSGDWILTLPTTDGSSGQFLATDGSGNTSWSVPSGAGDCISSATSADNSIARYDGTNNKTIQSSSVTISDDSPTVVTISSTDAGASAGPDLVLDRSSASAADSDAIGRIIFRGNDDAGTPASNDYASIETTIADSGAGSEDGSLYIKTCVAGTNAARISIVDGAATFSTAPYIPIVDRFNAVRITSDQTIPADTPTDVIFNSDSTIGAEDPGSDYNTSTGVYTVPTAGIYLVSYGLYIGIDSSPSHALSAYIYDGTNVWGYVNRGDLTASTYTYLTGTAYMVLAASATIKVVVNSAGHGVTVFYGSGRVTYFSAIRIGTT